MTEAFEMDYEYTGDRQPPAEGVADLEGRLYYPYLAETPLKKAVNLAIALGRPLLLEGEPGCGKTRLANAIAYEFSQKYLQKDEWWNFYIWNVKSTSRASNGLYTYDAVGRLRDAQLIGLDPERLKKYWSEEEFNALENRLQDKTKYRTFGKFGEALREQTHRPILLIDEIDKAEIDFANDLLLELDELRFEIPETGESFKPPTQKPIILITSNREKPLPEPFLRRCFYFYVQFPDSAHLEKIIQERFKNTVVNKTEIVKLAIAKFEEIRNFLKEQPGSRPPGTSEFLEFLTIMIQEQKSMEEAIAELNDLANQVHILGTLIKTKAEQDLYIERVRKKGK